MKGDRTKYLLYGVARDAANPDVCVPFQVTFTAVEDTPRFHDIVEGEFTDINGTVPIGESYYNPEIRAITITREVKDGGRPFHYNLTNGHKDMPFWWGNYAFAEDGSKGTLDGVLNVWDEEHLAFHALLGDGTRVTKGGYGLCP